MKMSLPKKKKKKFFFFFFFFFRETSTSPWVPFRAKFRPLGRLFRPSRPLAWSLIWYLNVNIFQYFAGKSELMRLLIYSGFNPRQKDNFGQTPLHLACINGDLVSVRELCEQVIYD